MASLAWTLPYHGAIRGVDFWDLVYRFWGFCMRGVARGVFRTRIFEGLNVLYVGRD